MMTTSETALARVRACPRAMVTLGPPRTPFYFVGQQIIYLYWYLGWAPGSSGAFYCPLVFVRGVFSSGDRCGWVVMHIGSW